MKTKEFVKKVEELGFDVAVKEYNNEKCIQLFNSNGYAILKVSKECIYESTTTFNEFTNLQKDLKKQLFDLLVEYSSTPIKEREEEKKYYLKHKFLRNDHDKYYLNDNYLNNYTPKNNWVLKNKATTDNYKTQFTKQEIEELKEKFNTSLDDFEIIEVE